MLYDSLVFFSPSSVSKVILGWMYPMYINNALNFHKLSSEWLPLPNYQPLSDKLYISLHFFWIHIWDFFYFLSLRTEDWRLNITLRLNSRSWSAVQCSRDCVNKSHCQYKYVYIIIHMIIQWTTCIFNIFKLNINLNATKWWIILIYLRFYIFFNLAAFLLWTYLSCSM